MAYIVRQADDVKLSLGALALSLVVVGSVVGCAGADGADATDTGGSSSDIVGGKADATFGAAGYLTLTDAGAAAPSVGCNATLIAPRTVVTAAHCVLRHEASAWAFGTGDLSARPLASVTEVHVHPSFHPESQGVVDLKYALRMFDVAYVVLDRAVAGVTPAALPADAPHMGDDVHAIGYHAGTRVGAPARVTLPVNLAGDPIFEVEPTAGSALCVADGDEGSPVFAGTDARPILVGFFVGSVTQGLTDCVRYTQFLDGYESAFGYRDFFAEGAAAGR